jgi:hypothetical protein
MVAFLSGANNNNNHASVPGEMEAGRAHKEKGVIVRFYTNAPVKY